MQVQKGFDLAGKKLMIGLPAYDHKVGVKMAVRVSPVPLMALKVPLLSVMSPVPPMLLEVCKVTAPT